MSIIEQRQALANAVRALAIPDMQVQEHALDSIATLPAVVVGMPKWTADLTACLGTYEYPVAVIVARSGVSDQATIAGLDELWPQVADALGTVAHVLRAEYGQMQIGSALYPAQIIFCNLT